MYEFDIGFPGIDEGKNKYCDADHNPGYGRTCKTPYGNSEIITQEEDTGREDTGISIILRAVEEVKEGGKRSGSSCQPGGDYEDLERGGGR